MLLCSGLNVQENSSECLPFYSLISKEASRRKPETKITAYTHEPSPSLQRFSPSTFSMQLLTGHDHKRTEYSNTAFQEE